MDPGADTLNPRAGRFKRKAARRDSGFALARRVVLSPPHMIYLLRHGQTEWNRDRRLQGQGNSALTDLGRAQAELMAELLAREIIEPQEFRLVSSPLQRARETAEAVAGSAWAGHRI